MCLQSQENILGFIVTGLTWSLGNITFASGMANLVRSCALSLELGQLSSNLMAPQIEIRKTKFWSRK